MTQEGQNPPQAPDLQRRQKHFQHNGKRNNGQPNNEKNT